MSKQNKVKKVFKNRNHIDIFYLSSIDKTESIRTNLTSLRVFVTNYSKVPISAEIMNTYIENLKNCEVIFYDNSEKFPDDYDKYLLGIALSLNKPIINVSKNPQYDNEYTNFIIKTLSNGTSAGFELEKKYLISSEEFSNLITDLKMSHIYNITQFFDKNGVRYRKIKEGKNTTYEKNLKSDISSAFGKSLRYEIECEISKKEYNLKKKEFDSMKLYNRPINKIRWVYEYYIKSSASPVKIEFNEIKIGSRFLYMIEVEMPTDINIEKLSESYSEYLDFLEHLKLTYGTNEYNFDINVTEDSLITNKKLMLLNTKNCKELLTYVDYVNYLCPNSFIKPVKGKKK